MDKIYEDLAKLLDNPDTSKETKEVIKKLIEDEKDRHLQLSNSLENILKFNK